ncbi:MAG: chromosomal replication initiator protein DnaA [Coprococcus sp.]|nr:chromosomal replication initiator protein DnaA [Coprococcus sp.]
METMKKNWLTIIQKLKEEYFLSNISFETWIRPLEIYDIADNILYLSVPFKASIEHIRNKYLLPLQVCIAEVTGVEYDITFIAKDMTETELSLYHIPSKPLANEESSLKNKRMASSPNMSNLNPKYTFDTFVVGGNNNFAHAASLAVAESPGEVYNPLFLYGGVGLGKTHLMHSVAHYILTKDPLKKVLYVTSEVFTNELIDAIRTGKNGNESAMTAFRNKYRNNDVLLIDDVQFIIGKESTQEEFFHTFNHLHNSGKQIIISSDKPPKDMETLEARLKSRFEWGLIADISAPNYETRMAILYRKIELDHLERYNIPEEVLNYIATNIKTNIRELEGALNKLIALYRINFTERNLDISLASEALKDMISPNENRVITPEFIIEIVSEHFNIPIKDLKSNKRSADIANARQIAMYLCRKMTDTPLKTIGLLLGGRDHSTVNHGVDKVANEVEKNEAFRNTIDILNKKINPA